MPRQDGGTLSVSGRTYARFMAAAAARGISVAALVELAMVGHLPDTAVPVPVEVYRVVASVARRTSRPMAEVFDAMLVRLLDDAAAWHPPPARCTCKHPRVSHALRARRAS